MDMREQLYMLEIEKHRGIKDAAQALHISPPALSIFLGNLEERMFGHRSHGTARHHGKRMFRLNRLAIQIQYRTANGHSPAVLAL